jgi:uncharacterized zinc-type alcohol dehydrogenase-like protein
MVDAKAYAANGPTMPLAPVRIPRRDPGARDVQLEILFCGICHSDVHQVRNEWSGAIPTAYPIVPGHEIVGRVKRVGAAVTRFKPGDLAGVGCLVDSDGDCPHCRAGSEQFCPNATFTYNSPDKHTGKVTYGGYSDAIVVDERFVLRVPPALDPAGAAPLLCAGITTYAPLKRGGAGPGKKVGVIGLGGLGHMGVKLARAMGAEVVVFTSSPGKRDDARRLGAHDVVVSREADAMKARRGSFDLLLNTVSAPLVGAPEKPMQVSAFSLIFGRRNLAGSLIGGLRETQEMLDFCGERGITADVEVIPIQKVNEAYDRLARSDVKYRFSIDLKTI